ncbi:MAG TPA: adenylate/guanylate cyclase domain-containing protein, partial [Chitinophagaceae bacterium]
MSSDHKLAAIIFVDIAGYTEVMEKDEQNALELLNRFREVVETVTPGHEGRVVQYFGDGCLLAFESSTDCVDCAVALQQAFSQAPEVPVRIGMHLGEVIFKEGNVFGDGVNIASRIESLGIPGAILMSKTIRDQIKNKTDFLLVSLGSFD